MGCCQSLPADEAALVRAVQTGDCSHGSWRLLDGKQGNEGFSSRNALLVEACKATQLQCVEKLLKHVPIDCSTPNEAGCTPLHILILNASQQAERAPDAVKIAQRLLQASTKRPPGQSRHALDISAGRHGTPLALAVSCQQDAFVHLFLQAKFSLSAAMQDKSNVLHLAAKAGRTELLSTLIKAAHPADVASKLANQKDSEGNTPLHLALLPAITRERSLRDAMAMASALVGCGAMVDTPNEMDKTPLTLAADAAACVLAHSPASSSTNSSPSKASRAPTKSIDMGMVELLTAVVKGQVGADNSAAYDKLGSRGCAAIHLAARLGNEGLLTELHTRRARLDTKDHKGRLPILFAAQAGHKAVLLYILKASSTPAADALSTPSSGVSVLTSIIQNPAFTTADVTEVLKEVLRSDGGWNEEQRQAAQPLLRLVAQQGRFDVVRMLVEEGGVAVDVADVRGGEGEEVVEQGVPETTAPAAVAPAAVAVSPLVAAVTAYVKAPSTEYVGVVEYLMGQDANAVDESTLTKALDQALDHTHLDMVMAIVGHRQELVDHASPKGLTPLCLAIFQGSASAVEQLLYLNASTGPRRGVNHIPLHEAVRVSSPAIVDMLLRTDQGRQAVGLKDTSNRSVLDYLWARWEVLNNSTSFPTSVSNFNAVPSTHVAPRDAELLQLSRLLLLHPNCDPNGRCLQGRRPLHWAVHLGQSQLVQLLSQREKGVNPNLLDGEGVTALYRAVQKAGSTGHELVQVMLAHLPTLDIGASSRAAGGDAGGTVLHAAVAAANTALVREIILRPGVQVDMRAFTLCMRLISTKPTICTDIMAELLHPSRQTAGGGVNLAAGWARHQQQQSGFGADHDALPPLHVAVQHNNAALVQLLVVRADADVDEHDSRGRTPLHLAVERRAYAAASKLVALGAHISIPSDDGTTPLIGAVAALDGLMVKELLKSDAPLSIDTEDAHGRSALAMAVKALLSFLRSNDLAHQRAVDNATDILNLLLRAGADVNKPLLTGRQWFSDSPSSSPASTVPSTPSTARSLSALEDHSLTPLLAAISQRALPLVEILLREPSLEVNGDNDTMPAIQVAVQSLLMVTSDPSSAQDVPAPTSKDPWHVNLLFAQSRKLSHGPPAPVSTNNLPRGSGGSGSGPTGGSAAMQTAITPQSVEARQASMRILRRIALDERVDLGQLHKGYQRHPSLLMQLVLMGGDDALDLVKELLACSRDMDLNATHAAHGSAMHIAVVRGDLSMLHILASAHGVHFNVLDARGMTPLACAVAAEHRDAIQVLLALGQRNPHAKELLDPAACGPDPTSSPMAQALDTNPATLGVLLAGLQAPAIPSPPHPSHRSPARIGSSASSFSEKGTTLAWSQEGSSDYDMSAVIIPGDAPKYNLPAILSVPIDADGRHPLLAAAVQGKWEHIELLVHSGARLDVWGAGRPHETPSPGSGNGLSHIINPPSNHAATAATSLMLPNSGVGGFTPFSVVCQHIIRIEAMKDKSGADRPRRVALLMAQQESVDVQQSYDLHWAVLARHQPAVELLAPRAKQAGCVDLPATTPQGEPCTALRMAVMMDLVPTARLLMLCGAAVDASLVQMGHLKSRAMRQLLTSPPTPNDIHSHTDHVVGLGHGLITSSAQDRAPSTPDRAMNKDRAMSMPTPTKHGFSEPLYVGSGPGSAGSHTTNGSAGDLSTAFKTALSQAICEQAPVAEVVGSVYLLLENLVGSQMSKVVLHQILVGHIAGRMKKQAKFLHAIMNACKSRPNDVNVLRGDLLSCLEHLGDQYSNMYSKVVDWCTLDKPALIRRMLYSNEYREFWKMDLGINSEVIKLCNLVQGSQGLGLDMSKVSPGTLPAAELEAQLRTACCDDMRAMMRDIHATVILLGTEAHEKAVRMFKQFGLSYSKVLQHWLREHLFPTLVIKGHSLEIVRKLGRGPIATVYLARKRDSETQVVFKRFDGTDQTLDMLKDSVRSEGFIISALDHPSIIHLHGIVTEADAVGLIVDHHPSSLAKIMQKGENLPPMLKRVALALQIARGMAYLHGSHLGSIVHGDLKATNILMSRNGRAIIDFGLTSKICSGTATAATLNPSHEQFCNESSVFYQAPEIVDQLLSNARRQPASDVFAFGMLLLEIMTMRPARMGFARDVQEYLYKVANGQRPSIPDDLPSLVQYCIGGCWAQDEGSRPSFATVVDLLDDAYNNMVG